METFPSQINLYHWEPAVHVLGPGKRLAIWFQGCTLHCPGCISPNSHNARGNLLPVAFFLEKLKNTPDLEGITLSGGEPFQQPQALYELVRGCSALNQNLSILVYSGYRLEELKAFQDDKIEAILQKIDILIDGRYEKTMFSGDGVRGSTNQSIHFLSNRYGKQDLDKIWGKGIEVFINGKELFWAGVPVDSEFSNKFIEKLQKKGIL